MNAGLPPRGDLRFRGGVPPRVLQPHAMSPARLVSEVSAGRIDAERLELLEDEPLKDVERLGVRPPRSPRDRLRDLRQPTDQAGERVDGIEASLEPQLNLLAQRAAGGRGRLLKLVAKLLRRAGHHRDALTRSLRDRSSRHLTPLLLH